MLYPYQIAGIEWLIGKRYGILADDMGLGKSAQVITAARAMNATRTLVVCPAAVREHWAREWALWWPESPRPEVAKTKAHVPPATGPMVCSYDYARANRSELMAAGPWQVFVPDEAHRLKGIDTAQSQALIGSKGIAHVCGRVWAVTGTPMLSHPGELWTLFRVMGGTTASYETWAQTFCDGYYHAGSFRITGAKKEATAELRRVIQRSGLVLRRTLADVQIQLPPIRHTGLTVEADLAIERALCGDEFHQVEAEALLLAHAFEGADLTAMDVATLELLARSTTTLQRIAGLQKVQPVAEILREELECGAMSKVVVFVRHRRVAEAVAHCLKAFGPAVIYGGIPTDKRQAMVDRFQTDPGARVLVCNITAAGVGINLTAAHEVVMLEPEWVPGLNDQAFKRCHRHGQSRPVHVRWVELANSLDQAVMGVLRRKAGGIEAVWVDDGEEMFA